MPPLWSAIPWIGRFSQWVRQRGYVVLLRTARFLCTNVSSPCWEYAYPFSDFEVVVMHHLKFAPSQLHHGAWIFIKVFQICVDHNSWEPSLELSFISFAQLAHLGITHWSSFTLKSRGLTFSPMTGVTSLNVPCWWNLLPLRLTYPFVFLHRWWDSLALVRVVF